MTSEEKRQTHQRELAEKINAEARLRLAGLKGKTDEKKYVHSIVCSLLASKYVLFNSFLIILNFSLKVFVEYIAKIIS